MVLDHDLRPWFEPLVKVLVLLRDRDWTSLSFRSEIWGSQGVGVDTVRLMQALLFSSSMQSPTLLLYLVAECSATPASVAATPPL